MSQDIDRQKIEAILDLFRTEAINVLKGGQKFNSLMEGHAYVDLSLDKVKDEAKAENYNRANIQMIRSGGLMVKFMYDLTTGYAKKEAKNV